MTEQEKIRSILAGTLRGVVSQRLLPRIGGGRVAAVEVMVANARIARTCPAPNPSRPGTLARMKR